MTVKWEISDQTKCILEYYPKCVGYSEAEVADRFLKNLLGDPMFVRFLKSQRRNKRMVERMFYGDHTMAAIDDYLDANNQDASGKDLFAIRAIAM
jgi:hypothetical protein